MKFMFCVFCLLSATALAVEEEITCERFPDADTVTVDSVERVKYNPDGTYEQTRECWTKILTERGRRGESVLSLDYTRRYGGAAILYVGAIGEDGVEREIDVRATTKESTDNSSMSANIYDPLDRVITCTIPGLKVGETLHVKTLRKMTKAPWIGKWADLSVMEWRHPIVKSTYEVTAPASLPLKKIAIRNPLGNVVTNLTKLADGSLVYTFTATNSAQAFPEPDMPPLYTQVQNIRVSTSRDWPEISKWYWELCAPHLAKTNAAMVAMVDKLTRGDGRTLGDDEKVRAIFKFVSQEVRYMGLTMEDTSPGYAPHDVDITFDNRYGVCRDKAGLLVAMLRLAGFKAFPVMIHGGAKLDPEVPQPFFNHAIVAVEKPRSPSSVARPDYLLMDPTNENTKDLFPSYLCNNSYLVARPEGEGLMTSPVPPPEENSLDVVSSARLSRDGSGFFESRIAFQGINDTAFRGGLIRRTPEERVKLFERILKRMSPGAELVTCEILPKDLRNTAEPLSVKLAAQLAELVIRGETRDELSVPAISSLLGAANWLLAGSTSLETRKYTLKLDTTACVRERLTFDLGGALGEVLELPKDEKTSNGYDYSRTFAVTNGILTMDRSLTIGAVEFSPEAYLQLREEIKRVEAAERKKPLFKSDFTRDANVRRILDLSETTLLSPNEWVTTNVDVTEVLTYKGKKDEAELKLAFHPSWKKIELVSATVSNRNGKVHAVSPREVNVLDCDWASAAPRYPAGKLMVVNLPSVEIGSVISVKTVVTVTNAPAPYYAVCHMDSYLPTDRFVRRIGDFSRDIRRMRRLPDEPAQPSSVLWRDLEIISCGDWAAAAERLAKAGEGLDGLGDVEGVSDLQTMEDIRNWMAKYVKVRGPGLYELPLEQQLTDPAVVLKERYATRLDYVRTLCALLRRAGYKADVVFAAGNAKSPERVRQLAKFEKPNIRAFATALCRVRVEEGGFLGLFGGTKEYFIGTENEYTPLGATHFDGSDYIDPKTGAFGLVKSVEARYGAKSEETCEISVRENGAVDMCVSNATYGAGVGAFRKEHSEILPEMRSRFYQSLLGGIAQAASATSELATDVTGYPASLSFSCYIPDFATASGDSLSIELPAFDECLPNLTGKARETPFAVTATDPKVETVVVRFPEGYTEVEHLPGTFAFNDWIRNEVSTNVVDGGLEVRVVRTSHVPVYSTMGANFGELVKDWRRIASSRANRTVTVVKRRERP